MNELTHPINDQPHRSWANGLFDLFRRRPLVSALSILLLDMALSMLLTQLLKVFSPAGIQQDFLTLIVLSILTAGSLIALGWWGEAGYNSPTHWRNLSLMIIPALAVIVLPLLGGIQMAPVRDSLFFFVGYGLTAFHEETIFRGFILRILGPTGLARAIWLSALFFGLAHVSNVFVRSSPFLVLAQMVGAGTGGVGLAALRSKTNTIWLVIGIHFFEDFLLHYSNLPTIPVNVAQSVILFFIGLYLLWQYRREKMVAAQPV